MIPFEKNLRIKALRKKYIRYGKEKLKVLYEKLYPDDTVTSWWDTENDREIQPLLSPGKKWEAEEEKETLPEEEEDYWA